MKHLFATKRYKEYDTKYFVFDVETKGLKGTPDSFVFGCIYGHNYKQVFYSHDEFERILDHKRFRNSIVFAHNAEFDLSVMYGNIIKNLDEKAIFNNRFICARHKKLLFADSFNIFGFSVAAIGEQIGLPKLEIDSGFKDGSIGKITEKHIEYCYRDCEIVWLALNKVFRITGAVKITLAGLALHYFRNSFIKNRISSDDKYIYDFFDSYYGGRVEVFKLGKVKAYKYDVNSMYPYAMKHAVFPNPMYMKVETNPHITRVKDLLNRFEGLLYCTVYHEQSKFGYLPYREKEGNNKFTKLLFPVGTFSGCWNFNEIRFAVSRGKVRIIECTKIVFSTRYQSPFFDFITTVYKLRTTAKGIDKTIYKLILNSLYGKFAQRINYSEEYHEEVPFDKISELQRKGIEYELKMFSHEREDCYLRIANIKNLSHTIPLFSSYITSFARVHLLKFMEENEKGLVYVDTDSICSTIRRAYNSMELGEMKKEPAILTEIFGNKSYTEEIGIDKFTKLKGIPKKAKKIGKNKYEYLTMMKTKQAIRNKKVAGEFNLVTKELTFAYDKRTIGKNGVTHAIILTNGTN